MYVNCLEFGVHIRNVLMVLTTALSAVLFPFDNAHDIVVRSTR